jgi:hypothetical protein
MNGAFACPNEIPDDPYLRLMFDMVWNSIKHSQWQAIWDVVGKGERKKEVYESRCYILSEKFFDDCIWLDLSDDFIESQRGAWSRSVTKICIVCGRNCSCGMGLYMHKGYYLCWEHNEIVKAYDNNRDVNEVYKYIAKKKAEHYGRKKAQKQLELVSI